MQKKEIRKWIRQQKKEMPMEVQEYKSNQIMQQLENHSWYIAAELILCYVNIEGEVITKYFLEKALAKGKTIAVPKITDGEMKFYQIQSLDELEAGYWGIQEPISAVHAICPVQALMIVPGVAFDRNRHRIGYGGGFYDRYFNSYPQLKRAAVAFDFQILDNIPVEAHDLPVDLIFTEKGIVIEK